MFPVPEWTGNLRGTPRDPRRLFDAIRYKLRSGCAWNLIPHDFPSGSTVFKAYQRWVDAGIIDRVHDTLREMVRVMEDRSEVPTAGIIDSQSVKGSGNGGPSGFDGGKKVNGRKRHIIVDVLGLILAVHITAANVQDRDAAVPLIAEAHEAYPTLVHIWTDCGYNGDPIRYIEESTGIDIEMVSHEPGHRGFELLRWRWIVERTNAWFGRFRTLNKEYERTLKMSRANVLVAMSMVMLDRLTLGRRSEQR
jgi:putative transposase